MHDFLHVKYVTIVFQANIFIILLFLFRVGMQDGRTPKTLPTTRFINYTYTLNVRINAVAMWYLITKVITAQIRKVTKQSMCFNMCCLRK